MIRVTCAIIRNEDNEVLVVQRGNKGHNALKWEFPGGKVREDESEEECIIREIREELSMDIIICSRMEDVEYDYGVKKIILIPFICDTLDDVPFLSEHADYKWLSPDHLMDVDLSQADIVAAHNYLKNLSLTDWPVKSPGTTDESQIADDTELKSMVSKMMGMKNAEWVAASAIDNPDIFRRLLKFSYSDDRKLAFHASWILSKVCDIYPDTINPYLPGIIESLEKIDNESAQRSFLRIISMVDLSKISNKHHGLLADHCFAALKSGFSAIAIKAYSMEILYKLALIYPELTHELSATINVLEGEGSAGVIARGRIILKKLAGLKGNLKGGRHSM
jgi:8-oxo-dGTP diphosphatase